MRRRILNPMGRSYFQPAPPSFGIRVSLPSESKSLVARSRRCAFVVCLAGAGRPFFEVPSA